MLLPADLLQQVIQIAGGLGDKFTRRLVCGDLTFLTSGLDGKIFVAVHDPLQDRRVEAAHLLRERGIRQSPDIQGIEALENIPAQGGKSGELGSAGLRKEALEPKPVLC